MNIAYTMALGRGDTDRILAAAAERLIARGRQLCGTVQINSERADQCPCDMDVRVLPNGLVICISQTLGRSSRGCRLDPQALETAVGLVGAHLQNGADALIVNKFGKHEADGRGFRDVIAEAMALNIPVLVGLNAQNKSAFMAFTEGLATPLPPAEAALTEWIESCFAQNLPAGKTPDVIDRAVPTPV